MKLSFITRSVDETVAAAESFGRTLRRGDCVALVGTLGTGKTQFVKGICRQWQARDAVASPTFVVMNRYSGTDADGREILLYHCDWYRVRSSEELYDLGIQEFLSGDGISMVEWADAYPDILPERHYRVRLSLGATPEERTIEVSLEGAP